MIFLFLLSESSNIYLLIFIGEISLVKEKMEYSGKLIWSFSYKLNTFLKIIQIKPSIFKCKSNFIHSLIYPK